MKRFLLLFIGVCCLVLGLWKAEATDRFAATASEADAVTAYNSANNWDRVLIPPGTATWSSKFTGAVMTKSVTIVGAGTNSTIINVGTGLLFDWKPSVDLPLRITGMRFNNSMSQVGMIQIQGPARAVRMDHLILTGGDRSIMFNSAYGGAASTGSGPVYGVVDHVWFLNSSRAAYVCDHESTDSGYPPAGNNFGATDWHRFPQPGTTNMVVYEDCIFEHDASFSNGSIGDTTSIYGAGGGQRTFRWCTFKGACTYIDMHGDYPDQSVVFYDVYNCVFTYGSFMGSESCNPSIFNQRGGMTLYHDNNFVSATQPGVYGKYFPYDVNVITNTYIWNNTNNGSTAQGPMYQPWDYGQGANTTGNILQDRNFFLHAPQSGQNFFPYNKLIYPHPLVTLQDGGSTPGDNTAPTVTIASPTNGVAYFLSYPWLTNLSGWTFDASGTLTNVVFTNTTTGIGGIATLTTTNFSCASNHLNAGLNHFVVTAIDSSTNSNVGTDTLDVYYTSPNTHYVAGFGDSETRGNGTGVADIPGGYRPAWYLNGTNFGLVFAFIGNSSENPSPAIPYNLHDGYGGEEIDDMQGNLTNRVSTLSHVPDVMALFVYLNDFRHNNAIATITNKYELLLSNIWALLPSVKIIAVNANPWSSLGPTNAALNQYFTPYLQSIVNRQKGFGHAIVMCDVRNPILTDANLGTDHTHFDQTGYNILGTNLFLSAVSFYDTNAPAITITSPTNGTAYDTTIGNIVVSGTCSDDLGVVRVDWTNTRGGSGTATMTSPTAWTQSGIVLLAGGNVLTFSAYDAAGNFTSDAFTVTYTVTTPPLTGAPSSLGIIGTTSAP